MGAATANGQMDPGGAGARKGEPKEQKPGLRSICRRDRWISQANEAGRERANRGRKTWGDKHEWERKGEFVVQNRKINGLFQ